MKKIHFLICILCALAVNINAQTTYDAFTYTEPKGYKKELKPGTVTYTKTDNKTGTYCIISLYAQSPSSGDLVKDFDNDWRDLVATTFNITAAPEKDNGDEITGWKTYSGAANFEFGGGTSMALLTTAKKDNANAVVLIVTNAQSFLTTDVDAFYATLKLGSPKKALVTQNNTPANNNVSNNIKPTSIIGEWYLSDGNAKITLLFGANGRYDKGAIVDRRLVANLYETTTIKGKGSYTINGSTLTLTPTTDSKEVYQIRFSTETDSEGKPQQILHLKRPVAGGQMYESDYYFVRQKSIAVSKTTTPITTNAASSFNSLNGSGITGVWVAYKKGTFTYSDFSWYWLVFFNNGKSLSNMPNGGFANLQKDQYFDVTRNNKEAFSIGTYSYSNGNGINIAYDGSPWKDKIELVKSPNQIKVDGANYMKCSSVNGQKLSGSFTTFGNIADATINQVSGFRSVITFTADGKFVDEGIYQVLLKDYGKSEAYNAAGKGTYELKDYSIILKFDDGRIKQEAFSMPFSYTTNNTTVILIGTAQLNKMK